MDTHTKIAVTVWGNRISPVFDSARTLLIARIQQGYISNKEFQSFDPSKIISLIKTLESKGVSTLVCGAISTRPAQIIVDHHIHLISFVMGDALDFLGNYSARPFIDKTYIMPGCHPSG